MRNKELQTIDDIDQELKYQKRSQTWDYGIAAGGMLAAYLMIHNINIEPRVFKAAVVMLAPAIVTAGGFIMSMHRGERIQYLQGRKDGVLQEAQRTVTLANKP